MISVIKLLWQVVRTFNRQWFVWYREWSRLSRGRNGLVTWGRGFIRKGIAKYKSITHVETGNVLTSYAGCAGRGDESCCLGLQLSFGKGTYEDLAKSTAGNDGRGKENRDYGRWNRNSSCMFCWISIAGEACGRHYEIPGFGFWILVLASVVDSLRWLRCLFYNRPFVIDVTYDWDLMEYRLTEVFENDLLQQAMRFDYKEPIFLVICKKSCYCQIDIWIKKKIIMFH